MKEESPTVDIDEVMHLYDTGKAMKFRDARGNEFYVPFSLAKWDGEILTLPEWKAKELGLI